MYCTNCSHRESAGTHIPLFDEVSSIMAEMAVQTWPKHLIGMRRDWHVRKILFVNSFSELVYMNKKTETVDRFFVVVVVVFSI